MKSLEIGTNSIKAARLLLKMTQRDIADVLGVKQQSVAAWESGSRPVPDAHKIKLAELLELDVAELISSSSSSEKQLHVTKKEIAAFLGSKEDWRRGGLRQAGMYTVKKKAVFFIIADTGRGVVPVPDAIYNHAYDTIVDFTDYVRDWLDGEISKVDAIDSIFNSVNAELNQ